MDSSRSRILKIAVIVLRAALGVIFIYAGYVKVKEPWQLFAAGILEYNIVPVSAASFVARTLPWFEILLGVLLVVGRFKRSSTVAVSGLLVVFFGLMVRAFAQGKEISCGCFGPGEVISWKTLLRDGSMLVGSLFVTVMAFLDSRRKAA